VAINIRCLSNGCYPNDSQTTILIFCWSNRFNQHIRVTGIDGTKERLLMGKVTVVLDDDVEELVRKQTRKKGDFSKIVNEALREKLGGK